MLYLLITQTFKKVDFLSEGQNKSPLPLFWICLHCLRSTKSRSGNLFQPNLKFPSSISWCTIKKLFWCFLNEIKKLVFNWKWQSYLNWYFSEVSCRSWNQTRKYIFNAFSSSLFNYSFWGKLTKITFYGNQNFVPHQAPKPEEHHQTTVVLLIQKA